MKFKKSSLNVLLAVIAFGVIIASCKKDEEEVTDPPAEYGYSNGMYVVNEGPFQTGTGTIDFINNDGERFEKIFQTENNAQQIGNLVQSIYSIDNLTYIIVNNANKIEIVETTTFQSVGTLENLTSPRYLVQADENSGYVSCWDNTVKIIKLDGTEILGSVDAGTGPEKMMKVNDEIWVLNQGGFSIDSTISVIDINTSAVTQTIQVYPKPSGIQTDNEGNLWIMCSGKGWNGFPLADDSEGHLVCINPADHSIIKDLAFPNTSDHPEKLMVDDSGSTLFYNYPGGVYKLDISASELESTPFISRTAMFYGLGYNPENNTIFGSDPLDYIQNGWVFWYDADNGIAVDSTEAGIIPGEFQYVLPIITTQK